MFPTISDTEYQFPIKGSDEKGTIKLVKNPHEINQEEAKRILVESFIGEYHQYLQPEEIDPDLTCWRNGETSVERFYQTYFAEEFQLFNEKKIDFWVEASINGTLVGWATFQFEQNDKKSVYMNLLIVDPNFQKKGIGEQLVKSLINLKVIPDLARVSLFLREKNKGGWCFYNKLGFVVNDNYSRSGNFVDMNLLKPLTWKNPKYTLNADFGNNYKKGLWLTLFGHNEFGKSSAMQTSCTLPTKARSLSLSRD